MAIALFGGNDLVLIDGVEVDTRVGEFHSFAAQPTNFAIESGATAADHIVEQPDQLEIAFVMSNLDEPGSSYGNRAAVLTDALRSRLKRRELWEIVTRHRLYPSVAITSIRLEHTGPFSGALRGRISFQEVNRDRLTRVKLPASRTPRKTASSQVDAGRVEPKTPTPAEKQRSGLAQIFGG